MAYIAIEYEPLSVLICSVLTLAIVFGLTLYAIFTKNDITMCGGTLASLSMIVLVLGEDFMKFQFMKFQFFNIGIKLD